MNNLKDDQTLVDFIYSNTSDFCKSLVKQYEGYGRLSDKQWAAVRRMIEQDKTRAVVDFSPIKAVMDTASANGLKYPMIRLQTFTVSKAPESGSNPGFLYIKEDGIYKGKISPDGKFFGDPAILKDLTNLATDPLAALKAYGRETGTCSCCGRELTDPSSIEMGIGPICAAKFGF